MAGRTAVKKYKKTDKKQKSEKTAWGKLLPAVLTLGLLPLIAWGEKIIVPLSSYSWFPADENQYDFFIHAKGTALIILAVWMLIVLTDRRLLQQVRSKDWKPFAPVFLYGALTLASAVVSGNKTLSFKGMWQMDESVWVLLAYLAVTWYCYQVVDSLKDIKILFGALAAGAAVQGILGLTQLAGKDFFSTGLGKTLLTLGLDPTVRDNLVFRYAGNESSSVYLASYTPNYAGVYLVMVIPVILVLALLVKKKTLKAALLVLCAVLAACLAGTGSRTGILALGILLVAAAWMIPADKRKKCLAFAVCLAVFVGAAGIYDASSGHRLLNSLKTSVTRKNYDLEQIVPEQDCIRLIYKGRELELYPEGTEMGETLKVQENGEYLTAGWDTADNCFKIQDDGLSELSFDVTDSDGTLYFKMTVNGIDWNFIKAGEKGGFLYINGYGKTDEIITAQTVFPGYEKALTGRGYLWGRTIPLLKDHILVGSGPDTFVTQFPQNDYVMRANTGKYMMDDLPTKAHSLYLQTALQTGVLSLVCLLAFWGRYLYKTARFLKKAERDERFYCCIGIFLAVAGYLMTGLLNDSNPAVSPVFWSLLGMGCAMLYDKKEHA